MTKERNIHVPIFLMRYSMMSTASRAASSFCFCSSSSTSLVISPNVRIVARNFLARPVVAREADLEVEPRCEALSRYDAPLRVDAGLPAVKRADEHREVLRGRQQAPIPRGGRARRKHGREACGGRRGGRRRRRSRPR